MSVPLHGGHQQSEPAVSVASPEWPIVLALGVLLVVFLSQFVVSRYVEG